MGRHRAITASGRQGERTLRRGMTLVEILAVVVILGLIAASLLTVTVTGGLAKGKRELARTGVGLIVSRLEAYRIEHDSWPDPAVGLAALSDGQAAPTAPYYLGRDQLTDPWGRSYQYVVPGPGGHPYEVICLGADGQVGGSGEDADLSSVSLRSEGAP